MDPLRVFLKGRGYSCPSNWWSTFDSVVAPAASSACPPAASLAVSTVPAGSVAVWESGFSTSGVAAGAGLAAANLAADAVDTAAAAAASWTPAEALAVFAVLDAGAFAETAIADADAAASTAGTANSTTFFEIVIWFSPPMSGLSRVVPDQASLRRAAEPTLKPELKTI